MLLFVAFLCPVNTVQFRAWSRLWSRRTIGEIPSLNVFLKLCFVSVCGIVSKFCRVKVFTVVPISSSLFPFSIFCHWSSVKYGWMLWQWNSSGFCLPVCSRAVNVSLWPECGERFLERSLGASIRHIFHYLNIFISCPRSIMYLCPSQIIQWSCKSQIIQTDWHDFLFGTLGPCCNPGCSFWTCPLMIN